VRILVLSAHPDDETLGCGGTLLRHVHEGADVHWFIATRACEPQWDAGVIASKDREIEQVGSALGVAEIHRAAFQTTRLDQVPQSELMESIRAVAERALPEVVYCVSGRDIHSDHRILFECMTAVFKPFHSRLRPRRILCYECLSSSDAAPPFAERVFVPNVFVEIGGHIEKKLSILDLYRSEIPPDPHPRGPSAVRALARLRGATIGVEFAEAFVLIREIV